MKIGTRVRYDGDRGTIVSNIKINGEVDVRWDWDAWDGSRSIPLSYLKEIDAEAEKLSIAKIQLTVNEATQAFKLAFQKLNEANELSSKEMNDSLPSLELIDLKSLEKTIEEGGWNSSSLFC